MPLISRGQCLGALTVQSVEKNAFLDDDIAVLQTMCDQLAIAIANAHLFDAIQQEMADRAQAEAALDQSLTIEQTLARHPRLGIPGEQGAGKSTLLDYLTLVFSGDIQSSRLTQLGNLLPVYLLLRNNSMPIYARRFPNDNSEFTYNYHYRLQNLSQF